MVTSGELMFLMNLKFAHLFFVIEKSPAVDLSERLLVLYVNVGFPI